MKREEIGAEKRRIERRTRRVFSIKNTDQNALRGKFSDDLLCVED